MKNLTLIYNTQHINQQSKNLVRIRKYHMPEPQDLCVSPAKGPIAMSQEETSPQLQSKAEERNTRMKARVGKPAPDFEASAFIDDGFKNVKLSEL